MNAKKKPQLEPVKVTQSFNPTMKTSPKYYEPSSCKSTPFSHISERTDGFFLFNIVSKVNKIGVQIVHLEEQEKVAKQNRLQKAKFRRTSKMHRPSIKTQRLHYRNIGKDIQQEKFIRIT